MGDFSKGISGGWQEMLASIDAVRRKKADGGVFMMLD